MSYFLLNKPKRIDLITIWLIAFFAISPSTFNAQNQRFSFHQLSSEEGLSQGSNDHIYHDSKGFIWLSSIDGLNRFDGKEVKVYKSISGDPTSLLGNIITSNFYEDKLSNLWFTTYEGIHCYIREQDHFRHFQLENEKNEKLKQDYYAFYLNSEGKFFVKIGTGKKGRLHLFDIENLNGEDTCYIDGQRNFPIIDKDGNANHFFSFRFINGKDGVKISGLKSPFNSEIFFDGKNQDFPSAYIYHVNVAPNKNCFLSSNIGMIEFNPLTKEHQLYNKFQNSDIGVVRSTATINDSTLWVASIEKGIFIFNRNKKQFVAKIPFEPQRKLGLKLEDVSNLYKDSKGNIWSSSGTSGVNFTNLSKRKFKTPKEFINHDILAIYESKKGEIFCSFNNDSIAYYPNNESEVQYTIDQTPNNIRRRKIEYFFEDKEDQMWGVTNRYLLKWDSINLKFNYIRNLPSSILYVFKNQEGKILMTTFSGIFEWKNSDGEISIEPYSLLNEHQKELATAIYEDKAGRLYLALDASRLLILNSENNSYVELKQIEGIGYAKSFFEEDGFLWIATSTGILKVNLTDLSSRMLNELEDGAPNESYYCLLPDDSGSFWLSCNRGIIRYFPKEKKHRRYTLVDGLQSNEYHTNAYLKTSNDEIWVGGTKGLNRFSPKEIQDVPQLPNVQITRLQVNDGFKKTEKQIGELEELDLEYFENTISFNFVGLEYSDPENNMLQYQMVNRDKEWVAVEKDGFARYSNLPSGDYLFKVKAANSDGVWNETPREIKIFIATPWYKTIWFYAFCVFSIAGIIYGLSMYRLQQALKFERLRVKISSDLHDDVGGLLAGLTMQSELLELTAAEERKPKLQRISELSRKAMSRMRDTVWAIDARKDKFENLLDRIREHAAETLEMKNIAFDVKIENIALDKNLNSQLRQNLYLICKEAITNTAKYSNGNQLNILFEKLGRHGISMTIHDNGKVEKKEHKSAGLGLSNMNMRAEQIGGKLEINRENGFTIKMILE